MTPSVWSVLVIFVLAPLGVSALITAVVLLLASPTRRPVVQPVVGADHAVAPALGDRVSNIKIAKEARAWMRPSDHVPVTATLELS